MVRNATRVRVHELKTVRYVLECIRRGSGEIRRGHMWRGKGARNRSIVFVIVEPFCRTLYRLVGLSVQQNGKTSILADDTGRAFSVGRL